MCSDETLPKVAAIVGQCPSIKNIIAFESQVDGRLHSTEAVLKANPDVRIHGYMDMMSMKLPKALPLCPPRPKDCAIIMYTSGSTGKKLSIPRQGPGSEHE